MSPVRAMKNPGYGPVGSAPDVVKAAHELLQRCGQWPYPWTYPPPGSQPLVMKNTSAQPNTIALPAHNVQTNVVSFNVPVGKLGYLEKIMLSISDPAYVEGLGMAEWSVVVNQIAGQTFAIGRPVVGYGLFTTQFGSIAEGPIELPLGVLLGSNDTVYIHITIPDPALSGGANPLGVGFPSNTTCWGLGWIWPVGKGEVGQ